MTELGFIDVNVQLGPVAGGARGAPLATVVQERDGHGIRTLPGPAPDRAAGRGRGGQPACSSTRSPAIPAFVPVGVLSVDRAEVVDTAAPLAGRVGRVLAGGQGRPGRSLSAEPDRPGRGADGSAPDGADLGLGVGGGDRGGHGGPGRAGHPDRQPLHDLGRGRGRRPALRAPAFRYELDGPLPGDRDVRRRRSARSASCSAPDRRSAPSSRRSTRSSSRTSRTTPSARSWPATRRGSSTCQPATSTLPEVVRPAADLSTSIPMAGRCRGTCRTRATTR